MSAHRMVTYEIRCDVKVAAACDDSYEALAGKPLPEARTDAAKNGWRRTRSALLGTRRTLDICPACTKALARIGGGRSARE